MAKQVPDPNQPPSAEERFQHDIEELESGLGWRDVLKWLGIIVIAVAVVAALYWITSGKEKPRAPKMSRAGTVMMETLEPASGKLSAAPTKFRWESVAGRNDYLLRILVKGEPRPVVERVVRENSAELLHDEVRRLQPGVTYLWEVEARAKDGKSIGSGRGYFEF